MSLGEKISALRKEKNYTQSELGNLLGVTYQAVSKWERDDSMPDFDMISKMAKLFGVSIAHFERDEEDKAETVATEADADDEPNEKIEGVCTVCGKMLTSSEVGVYTPKIVCVSCREQQVAREKENKRLVQIQLDSERAAKASTFNKRTIWACVVAAIIVISQLVGFIVASSELIDTMGMPVFIVSLIVTMIMLFTWVFQLFFDGAVRSVTLAGMFFIKLPGIIFSADLDGLIFLIAMKILFFIISAVVFLGAMVITSIAAMFVSLFTFVPVVIKIKNRNEDIL